MKTIIKEKIKEIEKILNNNWDFKYYDLEDNADKEIKIEFSDKIITLPKWYRIDEYCEQIFYDHLPEILIFNKYKDKNKIYLRIIKKSNFESYCYTSFEEKIRYFFTIDLLDAYALRDYFISNNDEEKNEIMNNIDNIIICPLTKTGTLKEEKEKKYIVYNKSISIRLIEYLDLAKEIFVEEEYKYLKARIDEINKNIYERLVGAKDDELSTNLNTTALGIIEKCLSLSKSNDRLVNELKISKNEYNILFDKFISNKEELEVKTIEYDWARPFITSEWLYQKSCTILFPMLDFTFICTGYIKAVEQLTYSMIKEFYPKFSFVYNGKQYTLKSNDGKNRFMIGPFLQYLENDKSEMIFTNEGKKLLIDFLKPWKENVRNDHFHKDNIKNYEMLNEIRHKTCVVIFLLIALINHLKYDFELQDYYGIDDESELDNETNYECVFDDFDDNDLPW